MDTPNSPTPGSAHGGETRGADPGDRDHTRRKEPSPQSKLSRASRALRRCAGFCAVQWIHTASPSEPRPGKRRGNNTRWPLLSTFVKTDEFGANSIASRDRDLVSAQPRSPRASPGHWAAASPDRSHGQFLLRPPGGGKRRGGDQLPLDQGSCGQGPCGCCVAPPSWQTETQSRKIRVAALGPQKTESSPPGTAFVKDFNSLLTGEN